MPAYAARVMRRIARVSERVGPPILKMVRGVPRFEYEGFGDYADYREWLDRSAPLIRAREEAQARLVPKGPGPGRFRVLGYCAICERWVRFLVDRPPVDQPLNWRESLVCPGCYLNNRMRAALALFRDWAGPAAGAEIYLNEQVTPLFRRVRAAHPNAVGSEFLPDGTPPGGENAAGVRHEDLTRLTFADARFDAVLSFEVLEHIPDYPAALRECARVLRPGGTLILTTPFHNGPTTTTRARVGPGGIEHLMPPEYHGDPLSEAGCLCFSTFGGDLLDSLKAAGFAEAKLVAIYSRPLGLLLNRHPFLVATR